MGAIDCLEYTSCMITGQLLTFVNPATHIINYCVTSLAMIRTELENKKAQVNTTKPFIPMISHSLFHHH